MTDNKTTYQDRLRSIAKSQGNGEPPPRQDGNGEESEAASCMAFGYLRGIRDQATSVELRFRDGNSTFFPYSWMGNFQYNPSEGLLLKFTGDVVYLVLIRGSNLDKPLKEGSINLTHAGLQRHRVLWLREMNEAEVRQVGENGPTIDSIQVAEFESHDALKEWVGAHAPAFLR
jgi:hypothetical protein